jgi:Flp pilus assembly protein TadD
MRFDYLTRPTLLLLVGSALLISGWFYWISTRQQDISFLTARQGAQWIVYPTPPDHNRHLEREVEAVYERSFPMTDVPASAQLSMRAFRNGFLDVNGTRVELPDSNGQNWKRARNIDVVGHLRKGDNVIRVTVANAAGPPALWLSLRAGDLLLGTDSEWQVSLAGAAWQPAWPASEPKEERPGNLAYGSVGTIPSLQHELPMLLLLAGVSAVLCAGVSFGVKAAPKLRASPRHVLLVLALFWLVLFWNNLGFLQIGLGFDASNHLTYIEYIQKNKRLPLANEGWEMYQPPLYYLLSASLLNLLGLPVKTVAAATVLRVLGCVIGIGQFSLVFAALRLLFPLQPYKQAVGLLCTAFLPPHLYLSQYVSNEMLAATLGSASIYLCLRVLSQDRPSFWLYVALGVSLGAALLTKFSTVLLVPVVLVVLLGRLLGGRQPGLRAALGIALVLVICIALSGWHYARVWNAFGNPLMGNWDPAVGEPWWQEPGFRTAHSYWGFGRVLVLPFRSGLHSVPDGFYSTLWGDGLYSGLGTNQPPWNHELMAVGYLLAIVPTLAVLAGVVVSLVQIVRRPSAEGFLLLGLALLVSVSLVAMTLKIPSYAQAKAFYGLFAIIPFAVFAARGFEPLLSRWRAAALPVFVMLGTWALTAYLALWIHGKSADAQAWVGWSSLREGNVAVGEQHFREALKADAHQVSAQVGLATALARSGRTSEAREILARAVQDHPDNAECYIALAGSEEQGERAVDELKKAIELAPDHPTAYANLAGLLLRHGQASEALPVFRQALRVTPYSPQVHTGYALSLAQVGAAAEAVQQFRIALTLQPDDLAALGNLAWIRATSPAARLRDGAEALSLAEHARTVAGPQDAWTADILAAAYAESGRYAEAEKTVQTAMALARAAGSTELLDAMAGRFELYQNKRPYRETPGK